MHMFWTPALNQLLRALGKHTEMDGKQWSKARFVESGPQTFTMRATAKIC